MFDERVFYRLYDDSILGISAAEDAEGLVARCQNDTATRAQLIHYYYNLEVKGGRSKISFGRFRHVVWFIKNLPDLKFCGGAPFYVQRSDPNYEFLKSTWLHSIHSSTAEMTRINACMFVANSCEMEGVEFFASIFPASAQTLPVATLKDKLFGTSSGFELVILNEKLNKYVLSENQIFDLVSEFTTEKDWNRVAVKFIEQSPDQYLERMQPILSNSLADVARYAGATAFKFESNSILGFDPEIMALRFHIACWIIRYLPDTKLCNSPIFVDPFFRIVSYDGLYSRSVFQLIEHVGSCWANALQTFPENKQVIRNARSFAAECKKWVPSASSLVDSELRKIAKVKRNEKK